MRDYVNEVKPFHTKLREYKLGYVGTDTQDGIFTDFDSPTFYDATTGKIRPLNVDLDTAKLTEFPWQMWNDYHKKHVSVDHCHKRWFRIHDSTDRDNSWRNSASTGPFQIQATSSSGSTSGTYGYYYPLFSSQQQAEIWDSQNGGSGATNNYTFVDYTGTFYGPSTTITPTSTKSDLYKIVRDSNSDSGYCNCNNTRWCSY